MLVNTWPLSFMKRNAAALKSLFAGGETGDWWVFDNVHTDQTTNGGNITTATGLINGRVMTSAGTSPTLNLASGKWAMRSAGSGGSRMAHNFGSVAQPGTIILALGNSQAGSARIFATGSSSGSRWQISNDSSDNIIAFAGSTLDSTINSAMGTRLLTVEFNGASSKFRVDGTQTAAATTGTQATDQLTLGALYDGTFPSTTNFYSALFINRILTTNERDMAERVLGSYAGLTW